MSEKAFMKYVTGHNACLCQGRSDKLLYYCGKIKCKSTNATYHPAMDIVVSAHLKHDDVMNISHLLISWDQLLIFPL